VDQDASEREIHCAYVDKLHLLDADRHATATPAVMACAQRARQRLQEAFRVLSDHDQRRAYDAALSGGATTTRTGLDRRSEPSEWGSDALDVPPYVPRTLWAAFEIVIGWLTPQPARPRKVAVPDFRGLYVDDSFHVAARAGVEISVVRLTARPAPAAGIVVDQEPAPDSKVRRGTVVTVKVLHPEP
jgi:hypothetical protein